MPALTLNKSILNNINNLALLKYLLALIDKVKEDENVLLISDFYKEIADIITKERVPFIYERLGVRYQHFLLDEFQDTSELQWINLIPLVHNSLAQKHSNLIVGDGKQAIYRWRNGEVEQFTKLPYEIHNPGNIPSLSDAGNLFKQMGQKITLTHNFRSAPEIVNFNNYFFKALAARLDEQLGYIYQDHEQTPTKKFEGYIEACLGKDLEDHEQINFVLDAIEKSLNKGFELKDICIIVRTNQRGAKIAKALVERKYQVISPDSLFISKDKTVQFLYYVMQALNNENDKNAKIKALEHYAVLKGKQPSNFIINQQNEVSDHNLQRIFKSLGVDLKQASAFHNLYDFVEYLIEAFGFDATRNPYLQFYLEFVHQFETTKSPNVRDFLHWFNEKGRKKSIISPEGSNAIKVMTVHKSKGLQFPIVICPFFDWELRLQDEIAWVQQANEPLPAYFVNMNKHLEDSPLSSVFLREKAKFDLDNFNLLYVAFTRPEVGLFISGASNKGVAKDFITPIFEQSTDFEKNDAHVYTSGKFNSREDKRNDNPNDNIDIEFLKQKMNKPQLSYKSALNWDVEELDQKRNFGTLIHHTLSKIERFEDLPEMINQVKIKQGLLDEESKMVFEYINTLFKNDRFATYYKLDSFNEKEILTRKGIKLIPDKILRLDDGLKVVDFKTGQASPSHQKQVESYIKALKDMGYNNVTGEVCYTEEMKFVEVG